MTAARASISLFLKKYDRRRVGTVGGVGSGFIESIHPSIHPLWHVGRRIENGVFELCKEVKMDSSDEGKPLNQKECVKVAVNIRPLITTELLMGCTDCVTVREPQVQIGSHAFTYDHVYGSSGSPSSSIFEECVVPLVDALLSGYNATVLAYGQTGSGKTYTMGTNYNGEGNSGGIIPQVMDMTFKKIDTLKESTEFLVRVSYIEIFKEEVFDLLGPHLNTSIKAEGFSSNSKPTMPSRVPIQIRETAHRGITLAGVTEAEVRSKEEMASYLTRGSLARATGSINMNSQSSRSHAIFTIFLEQKKGLSSSSNAVINNEVGDDILFAKLHLVDLAGSERAKRTGEDRLRFKEGVHINRGLLALGNVISALGDEKRRKEGGHVPYRDSKLTRLLQDSLGGNTKTVMIACISPADTNAEETINTLKYANRARNIQNKAVINRDPVATEMQKMRSQLEQLQSELLFSRGGGAPLEELQAEMKRFARTDTSVLKQHYGRKLMELEQEKKALQKENEDLRNNLANIPSISDDGAQILKEDYLQKLNTLEAQVSELRKKQDAQSQMLRQKQKSDEAAKRLQDEIQKVQLQHTIKQESEQFRLWKATREKEVLQLKKEGRRNEYEMHKLLALNQRQKMALQRKIEEASLATKRLKELLEAKETYSREISSFGHANGPEIQALMQAIEYELEVTVRVHEVRSEYERQLQERAAMAKEVARLKEESDILKQKIMSDCPQTMSSGARNSRIVALENMLATSSSTLVSMASQLSEAEEREHVFSGRGRWNQVRSLAEAKNLMNYLFNLASSSRCQLRDKEVKCRETDSFISELKEKVVRLNSPIRQLEAQVAETHNQDLQRLDAKKRFKESSGSLGTRMSSFGEDGHGYALRKGPRTSIQRSRVVELDQSETESDFGDEDWVESGKKRATRSRRSTAVTVKPKLEAALGPENLKLEILSDEAKSMVEKNNIDACCSCSRFSSCKTKKCECRAAGGLCGTSCRCVPLRCANREEDFVEKETEEASATEMAGSGCNSSSDNGDEEKRKELVSHGTMLLRSALSERLIIEDGNGQRQAVPRRKALSDIGNTANNPNVPKPPRRKNWHKSAIQLVPVPQPSDEKENHMM